MIENLHPEEEKIIVDIRNLFGLEKELDNTAILFRQKKKKKNLKQLKIEFLEISKIFLNKKKNKKIIIDR